MQRFIRRIRERIALAQHRAARRNEAREQFWGPTRNARRWD